MSFTVFAPAKLNLFLNIVGRREDGYHLLDSLFAFTSLADAMTLQASTALTLTVAGPFGKGLRPDEDNLILKAEGMLRHEAGVTAGARIHLEKQIPVAAGLGGGSADAAATLKALNTLWGLDWPLHRLEHLAMRLGADVPACLAGVPVLARGIGDKLTPAPALPPCGILLINPGVETPTPAVFKAFAAMNPTIRERSLPAFPARFDDLDELVTAIEPRGNDLLDAAISVTPEIGEVMAGLGALPDVAYAGLSGSGATCFALFETIEAARKASRKLAQMQPEWWGWAGSWAQ